MTWETSRNAVPEGITQTTIYDETTGERIATVFNAEAIPLIAAAPELLQLLESCIRVMQRADELSSDARYWIELGTLAIAKAKGIAS